MSDMAYAAAGLARRFGGVMSGEHGDGLQRSELNELIFGPELYQAMREFKRIWDPLGLMNPGKKVNGPPMTENLRFGPSYRAQEPKTYLDFSAEGGFARAVEMCNGAAVCRKLKAGTMCPSFMATRDEKDSTRGRANALRDVLARGTLDRPDLASKDVYDVLDLCLSCKACKTECPSSVDMAKLKTEFLAHYQAEHGASLRSRVFGHIHDLSRLASPVAPFVNLGMRLGLDAPVKKALGVAPERSLSPFAARTFTDHWRRHQRRHGGRPRQTRGKVVYFHDTFAEYNYPRIGMAAVKLLEAAGFEVIVEKRRVCCGRPLLSKGFVEEARNLARRNVEVLAPYAQQGIPIVGTEPSCILTLRDEYRDLLPDDADVAAIARESLHDRRVPGQAGSGRRPRHRLERRRGAGCPVPRALSSEGAHRHGPVDGDARHRGMHRDGERRRLLRHGWLLRLRSRALRGLAQDRRGTALPGGCGRDCRDHRQRGRCLLPAADRALHRPRDEAHRRGPGGADRPRPYLDSPRPGTGARRGGPHAGVGGARPEHRRRSRVARALALMLAAIFRGVPSPFDRGASRG